MKKTTEPLATMATEPNERNCDTKQPKRPQRGCRQSLDRRPGD